MQIKIDDGPALEISLFAAEQAIALFQKSKRASDSRSGSTLDFLRELADWLRQQGLAKAEIAVAWQFWNWLLRYRKACAIATKHQSQIAYWYKIDPFTLGEAEQMGLLANLHAMQCHERIYRRDFDWSDYECVYQLFKRAYDDEELAQRQKSAAFALFVDKRTRAN